MEIPFIALVGGWMVFIGFCWLIKDGKRELGQKYSNIVYSVLAGLGMVLAIAMTKQLFFDEPLVVIGLNMLFVVIAVLALAGLKAPAESAELYRD